MPAISLKRSFSRGFMSPGRLFAPLPSKLVRERNVYSHSIGLEEAWGQVKENLLMAYAIEAEAINIQKAAEGIKHNGGARKKQKNNGKKAVGWNSASH